jgi:hypothetical protein
MVQIYLTHQMKEGTIAETMKAKGIAVYGQGIVRLVAGVYYDHQTNWIMGECYARYLRQSRWVNSARRF